LQTNKTTKSEKKYVKSKIDGVYISLHKFILGSKENMIIDHINSDGLDNRQENLRFVTFSENNQNRIKKENSSSKYIGVSKQKDRFFAKYSNTRLGYFEENCTSKYIGVIKNKNKIKIWSAYINPLIINQNK
jgi:hypothetical protein